MVSTAKLFHEREREQSQERPGN